jgi:serine/threonine-protein kinase
MVKQIGKYQILRTLGQGAMGEVYLANHPVIGREVAIKTILPAAARGEDAEGRFRREAEAAGRLSHPNLVTIFDFDKDQEVFFLVMEYVKGDDLEDLIRDRALSHSQFLEVLAQVCDGLGHAHRHGIIHRDIKPANVRVVRDGKAILAKVMDFGIARVEDSSLTATGIVMGTVSYMAPEYIRDGHATAQSDLFAVGVMLYECLTGRKPFQGDNTTTILFKIVSDVPPPIDMEGIHGISPSIRTVLDRALAKDPALRFQSADELAKALRACKDPTWTGAVDEATAMLVRQRQASAEAATALATGGTAALASAGAAVPSPAGATMTGATAVVRPSEAPPTAMLRPADGAPAAMAPTAGPAAPARAGRTGLLVACAAGVLLAAGGGAFWAFRPRPAAPVPPVEPAATPAAAPAPTPAPPAVPAPVPAATPAPAPAPAPTPSAAVPARPAVVAAAKPDKGKAEPAPAKPAETARAAEPAKAPEPAPDPMKTIGKLIETDPRQAVSVLKPLVQDQPGNVERQGSYLAALYRSRNAWDFERALGRATAAGVTVKAMLGVPAFRAAMAEESRLQKAKPPTGVLPAEVMAKVVEGL